ncbi:MAG: hypothetical protein HPY75_02510 [Actinobacteria bacterium]|nr:hypothetical protein [Actinomycetota bacterium]
MSWRGRYTFQVTALLSITLVLAVVLSLVSVGCGGGEGAAKGAGEMTIEELWAAAQEADNDIHSWHMEIASYYERTQYGGGQIQSIIIDVNGEDVHEQDLLLGQVYFEYKRVGGKQYNKDMASGTWKEVPANATNDVAKEYSSKFLELPSLAESQTHVGTEVIGGSEAERFRFNLDPEAVKTMFSGQPSFDFSNNSGGEVEVWIDSDEYYLLRYEMLIRDVIIPEKIGNGDIRFVVNISRINEPVEIEAPI